MTDQASNPSDDDAPEPATDRPLTAEEVETNRRTRERRFEVVATALLAITALVTAWSGYQASLWDGIQSSNYTQASAARTEASQLRTQANQLRLADLSVFENWVDAYLDGDDDLTRFYEERFRDELSVAFDAWIALDPFDNPAAPPGPIGMAEYTVSFDRRAAELEEQAQRLFDEGEDANNYSDRYTLATLLFAVVLFFAAISERFEFAPMRATLLTLAGLGLIVGAIIAASQPVTSG